MTRSNSVVLFLFHLDPPLAFIGTHRSHEEPANAAVYTDYRSNLFTDKFFLQAPSPPIHSGFHRVKRQGQQKMRDCSYYPTIRAKAPIPHAFGFGPWCWNKLYSTGVSRPSPCAKAFELASMTSSTWPKRSPDMPQQANIFFSMAGLLVRCRLWWTSARRGLFEGDRSLRRLALATIPTYLASVDKEENSSFGV